MSTTEETESSETDLMDIATTTVETRSSRYRDDRMDTQLPSQQNPRSGSASKSGYIGPFGKKKKVARDILPEIEGVQEEASQQSSSSVCDSQSSVTLSPSLSPSSSRMGPKTSIMSSQLYPITVPVSLVNEPLDLCLSHDDSRSSSSMSALQDPTPSIPSQTALVPIHQAHMAGENVSTEELRRLELIRQQQQQRPSIIMYKRSRSDSISSPTSSRGTSPVHSVLGTKANGRSKSSTTSILRAQHIVRFPETEAETVEWTDTPVEFFHPKQFSSPTRPPFGQAHTPTNRQNVAATNLTTGGVYVRPTISSSKGGRTPSTQSTRPKDVGATSSAGKGTGEGPSKQKKRFICPDCNKEFSQLRNYRYHRSRHEGTTQFACTCPVCGKSFNDKGYLSSHLKIHRNAKEYKCEWCGKSFNQRVAYNMHVRIHTGLRPHQCHLCAKAFSRKMLLRQHVRTHTGERPYKCDVCGKAFADRSNMLLHQRLHSGQRPYKCEVCGKTFSKNHHLKTHLNHHAGIRPYQCEKCKACFSQSSNMKTHFKKCTGTPVDIPSKSNSPVQLSSPPPAPVNVQIIPQSGASGYHQLPYYPLRHLGQGGQKQGSVELFHPVTGQGLALPMPIMRRETIQQSTTLFSVHPQEYPLFPSATAGNPRQRTRIPVNVGRQKIPPSSTVTSLATNSTPVIPATTSRSTRPQKRNSTPCYSTSSSTVNPSTTPTRPSAANSLPSTTRGRSLKVMSSRNSLGSTRTVGASVTVEQGEAQSPQSQYHPTPSDVGINSKHPSVLQLPVHEIQIPQTLHPQVPVTHQGLQVHYQLNPQLYAQQITSSHQLSSMSGSFPAAQGKSISQPSPYHRPGSPSPSKSTPRDRMVTQMPTLPLSPQQAQQLHHQQQPRYSTPIPQQSTQTYYYPQFVPQQRVDPAASYQAPGGQVGQSYMHSNSQVHASGNRVILTPQQFYHIQHQQQMQLQQQMLQQHQHSMAPPPQFSFNPLQNPVSHGQLIYHQQLRGYHPHLLNEQNHD